ncbi:MAG TPA: hypothetical protein VFO39_13730 [Candidatus Sulfotelmatobacter sp.]|nr:hypothetical protein [Candidatus Sulfotelmatobacter sp.]
MSFRAVRSRISGEDARNLGVKFPNYYDFNVWSERKFIEKLRYLHRNPVTRGLVQRPEDWPWSSFRHSATDEVES